MNRDLKKIAQQWVRPTALNNFVGYGDVAAAIETIAGNIYTGISIDTACSMGFCAEHGAVADMLKHNEYRVKAFVAVDKAGNAVPPCGRCRELISQLAGENRDARVEVANGVFVSLGELLPYDWKAQQQPGAV
ncbi:cytidine deaminase family protein [Taibaiella chishuiensis]|uniref:Cytidine deaminase n=1 Tax=Taibaiella chishuiensis TaxID=1434707 RepID=A0A2P8CZP0_9BACT|nr:cytidine deaminase [Taibaiella chishuiensis]PSK90386.1 cytidine deaminase [Taibaiella chishuiensis]